MQSKALCFLIFLSKNEEIIKFYLQNAPLGVRYGQVYIEIDFKS